MRNQERTANQCALAYLVFIALLFIMLLSACTTTRQSVSFLCPFRKACPEAPLGLFKTNQIHLKKLV